MPNGYYAWTFIGNASVRRVSEELQICGQVRETGLSANDERAAEMKNGIKKLALVALLVAAAGWTATAEAAPMLPRSFMFYSSSSNMVAFRHTAGFYMYFTQWRKNAPNWGAHNIAFATVVQGKRSNLPLPTPWKIAKDNKGNGGWATSTSPSKIVWTPGIPEPTGLAAIGGAALLLIRRKREA